MIMVVETSVHPGKRRKGAVKAAHDWPPCSVIGTLFFGVFHFFFNSATARRRSLFSVTVCKARIGAVSIESSPLQTIKGRDEAAVDCCDAVRSGRMCGV